MINEEKIAHLESERIKLWEKVQHLEELIINKPQLEEQLNKYININLKADDFESKLTSLINSISEKKKEVDKIYFAIFGYTENDENGKPLVVDGLKKELEQSYNALSQIIDKSKIEINDLVFKMNNWQTEYITNMTLEYNTFLDKSKYDYKDVLDKIKNLLPNALTTGLSYAYSEKKSNEENESDKHYSTFKYSIFGLVLISLLPISISIYSMYKGDSISIVIERIPRLAIAFLPLYLPILWVAYSANKKLNLSKRLIEEYSHKEVLSKTFEGLSSQIKNIEDQSISNDLSTRLLYNILEVNSENPGKLISDYDKTDHPILDTLDKSIKLTNSISKLSKIPGLSRLLKILEKKNDEMLKSLDKKSEDALESINL